MNKTLLTAAFLFSIVGAGSIGYSAGVFTQTPQKRVTETEQSIALTPIAPLPTEQQQTPPATKTTTAVTKPPVPNAQKPPTTVATKPTPIATPPVVVAAKPTPTPSTPPPAKTGGFTIADVASHATSEDCWVIVSGKIYNMTTYMSAHPGGRKAISRECGKDATSVFANQDAHSQRGTDEELNLYFIAHVQG